MKANDDKRSSIQIDYDAEKLEALRFYLSYKGSSLEQELNEAVDAVYKKSVPAQVREYIERKNSPPPQKSMKNPDKSDNGEG